MVEHTASASRDIENGAAADAAGVDPRVILMSIGEIVYDWRLDSDDLRWGANALQMFGLRDEAAIRSGAAYAQLIDPGCTASRHDAIVNSGRRDLGTGVPYSVQYLLAPHGRTSETRLWVEDVGRWFAGAGGRPQRAHGVVRLINERHAAEKRMVQLARYDELTGQMTRQYLADVLAAMLDDARHLRISFGFMIAGVENISAINEAYGFEIADEVLIGVARRVRGCMRGGDGLARYSGSKFGLIINNCDTAEMPVAAQRFIDAVSAEPFNTKAGPIATRISVGGVLVPRHVWTVREAMGAAQEALDTCRQNRRGGFAAYAPNAVFEAQRRQNAILTHEIIAALNERRIVFAYEPIVDATSREPAAYECLVRLRKHDGSVLGSASIVPISEKLGFVHLIDHRALELAVAALAAHPDLRLTMNISAATAADQDWLSALALSLHRNPGVASRLTVEITESAVMADLDMMRRFIRIMKDNGTRIAVDDFGAGYTSFRALRELGIDMVKIDGVFVQNLVTSSDDRFFVRTLLDLAHHLGLETVAEWVQDEESAAMLAGWGCHYFQGALIGAPQLDKPWSEAALAARPAEAGTVPLRSASRPT